MASHQHEGTSEQHKSTETYSDSNAFGVFFLLVIQIQQMIEGSQDFLN